MSEEAAAGGIQAEVDLERARGSVPAGVEVAIGSREVLAVGLWTVAADLLVFRTGTYLTFGIFVALSPLLFRIGARERPRPVAMAVCGSLAAAVVVRLGWLGNPIAVASGVVLIVAMAMAAGGARPLVIEGAGWLARSVYDGMDRVRRWRFTVGVRNTVRRHGVAGAVLLPLAAAAVFATLFILANPDLLDVAREKLDATWTWIVGRVSTLSVWEVPFCVLALMLGAGLMRPGRPAMRLGGADDLAAAGDRPSALYAAYRNTLATLVVLFAVYLTFEFRTLWRRDFPDGFYYAGYAHQGAAWLTAALVVATGLLSVVFGRSLRHDPRRARVRRLAWVWSAENFLLAAAVYNRLAIYVGYNGMTRMRTVGFFGITLVVVGFALVVGKIARSRSFWWLLRAQLVALVLAVIVYGVWPVDYLAHRHNVRRVDAGYPGPSVMVAVKPIDDEGLLTLFELVDHPDGLIRRGVRARLAGRAAELTRRVAPETWERYQGATRLLSDRLDGVPWRDWFDREPDRRSALREFKAYAMRWY